MKRTEPAAPAPTTWAEKAIDQLQATAETRDLTPREQQRLDAAIAQQNAASVNAARFERWDRETR